MGLSCYDKFTKNQRSVPKKLYVQAACSQTPHWLRKTRLGDCKKAPAVTAIVTNTHKAGTLVALPKVCVGAYNEL